MYNILICDDEQDIVNALKIYLSGGDYCLFEASNGREALEVVEKNDIHLILMDIMMPQLDGIAATAKLREKSNVPIILLTAKSESSDKVLGLNIGADDYITKPFSMLLLGKRVAALLRRCGKSPELNQIQIGDITVDFGGYTASGQNGPIDLTPKEIDLLKLLVEHKGLVLTRSQILDELWGYDYPIIDRTIDTYIKNLRKKLGLDRIVTVKGVGYKYEEQL